MEERLWSTITQINEWVRYSDGKGVALLGIQGVLIGLALTFLKDFMTEELHAVSMVLFILGIVNIIVALFCTFFCLVPRLDNQGSKSLIYFKDIVSTFKTPEAYTKSLETSFSAEKSVNDTLAEQIYTNSSIANAKFKWVSWSIRLTLSGLAFWAIFLLITFLWR